ncbi:MAG: TIGR03619 family F420-dependent LLM class oxidoreductase [Candidatus Dadabacteria bacterium]|nr:TIGR03619 family F420-dependent LLM class oxidoreductase [Candidatus Dadabacteria bacterium]
MSKGQMKFGIAVPNFGMYANKDSILKIAKIAEDLGFDSIWVSDHIVIPESHQGFGNVFYEPLVTLSYIASLTTRIHLGTSVIILPYRNPLVLAKMLSTLDVISDGRLILGVGAGWLKEEFQALGASYEKRGSITDEYIKVLKELWTKEKPRLAGRYIKFSDINFLPKPVQKPHPLILVGGNSRIAIRRAVNLGNGWHAVGLTPDEIKEKVKYLNELLEERKNTKSDFIISLRKNLQIKGISGKKLKNTDERETLRGVPEKIVEGIEYYRDAGVSHLIFHVLSGSMEGVLETMKVFSREIRPALKL